ncbi:MAG TPA: arginine deiminase-related protein [Flavobacteriaceae bacterium]|nr:arginine deiminase-related protein [Flavobacteriaceae bacterium]
MLQLHITDETSPLKAVVLGRAESSGDVPKLEDAYDPKSKEHIKAGTYPVEADMVSEIKEVEAVLKKYNVEIFRPKLIEGYNQIFSRDIAFVIEDKFIKANILPDRELEIQAISHVMDQIDPSKIVKLPEEAHVEGGDVMPFGEYIFVGTYRGDDYSNFITARTNMKAVRELQNLFPHKKVKSFNLRKSNTDAKSNALHLDCCYQPVGKKLAVIHKNGFLEEAEYQWLVNFHGKENVFEISADEMYEMYSNFFSISPEVVISDKSFARLNNWLRRNGITVEEVNYREIAKQEGLLRCTTLPLIRE